MDAAARRPDPARAFRRGFLVTVPMQVATIPFGLIFGALAIETGLKVSETVAMSIIVVGGVSQLVALKLMAEHAPAILVVLTAVLVNLRMAMYSASLAVRWEGVGTWPRALAALVLNDQSYAIALRRYDDRPEMTPGERAGFFLGSGTCCFAFWACATLAGALVGTRIPADWHLEFAVPCVFIAVSAPFLRNLPSVAAALTACTLAVVLRDLPHSLGLILGSAAGIAVGVVLKERRR